MDKYSKRKQNNPPYTIGYDHLLTRMAGYWPCANFACVKHAEQQYPGSHLLTDKVEKINGHIQDQLELL